MASKAVNKVIRKLYAKPLIKFGMEERKVMFSVCVYTHCLSHKVMNCGNAATMRT